MTLTESRDLTAGKWTRASKRNGWRIPQRFHALHGAIAGATILKLQTTTRFKLRRQNRRRAIPAAPPFHSTPFVRRFFDPQFAFIERLLVLAYSSLNVFGHRQPPFRSVAANGHAHSIATAVARSTAPGDWIDGLGPVQRHDGRAGPRLTRQRPTESGRLVAYQHNVGREAVSGPASNLKNQSERNQPDKGKGNANPVDKPKAEPAAECAKRPAE